MFEKFTLVDEKFTKASQILETCVSVNNNLSKKLGSSLESPTISDERLSTNEVT